MRKYSVLFICQVFNSHRSIQKMLYHVVILYRLFIYWIRTENMLYHYIYIVIEILNEEYFGHITQPYATGRHSISKLAYYAGLIYDVTKCHRNIFSITYNCVLCMQCMYSMFATNMREERLLFPLSFIGHLRFWNGFSCKWSHALAAFIIDEFTVLGFTSQWWDEKKRSLK